MEKREREYKRFIKEKGLQKEFRIFRREQVSPPGVHVRNIKGKRYFVVYEQGRRVQKLRYTPKLSIEELGRKYKKEMSIIEGVERYTDKKWSTIEMTERRKSFMRPRKKYQYVVELHLKSGKVIAARSVQYDSSVPLSVAKSEAWEKVYGLLYYEMYHVSDKNEGKKFLENNMSSIKVKEGVVYYRNKNT